jgi:PTH1 family peptidyl-tRNA hydrolase
MKMNHSMYLIVGLGNPGREYKLNRHNIGYRVIDHLSREWGIPLSHVRSKSIIGYDIFLENKIVLAKPQTFMNQSGEAVCALFRFYKTELDKILIIFDDLDLPLGTLRFRPEGGSGGHKGMTSIIDKLGSKSFPRMRLGIGRPRGSMDVADFVLQDFSADDEKILQHIMIRAEEAIRSYIQSGVYTAMSRFNTSVV